MNIKSIKIKAFKSVNTPQTIEIGGGGLITLIGKNGSGKTNLLEAINKVFEVNASDYQYWHGDLRYSVILELDGETVKELSENIGYDPQDRFIEVYNDGYKNDTDALKVTVMRSRLYEAALKNAAAELKEQAKEVSEKLKSFEKNIEEIRIADGNHPDAFFYKLEDVKNSQFCTLSVNYYINNLQSLAADADGIVKKICNDEHEIALNGFDGYSYGFQSIMKFSEPNFRLVYREPYMTELDKRFVITIDRDKIKYYIEEVNEKIAGLSSELKKAITVLNAKITKFNKLTKKAREKSDDEDEREQGRLTVKENFLAKVPAVIRRKSYYIPAGGEMIFGGEGRNSYRVNYDDVLIKTYIGLKFEGEERAKILSQFEKDRKLEKILKKLNIDVKEFSADFEAELNKDLPEFDRSMITKIEVGYRNGIELFVIEKNNTRTPFENTSLGRRWYYTYYFIKKCLKEGDVLILDEPGSFLHPEAQCELLRDLESIAKTNTVIICTHSPYMISEKYNNIHVVRMSENGTSVKHINLRSLEKLRKDAGLADFDGVALNSIILNFPRDQILCEGARDKACLEAFMDYLKVDRTNYAFMQLMGCSHAYPLIEFYLNNNVNVRILLDMDAKEDILKKKIKVPKYIDETESAEIGKIPAEYLTLVFAGSGNEGGRKDIEGLFSDGDADKFLERVPGKGRKARMDIADLLAKHGCSEETEKNFKELFKKLKLPVGKK